MKWLFWNIQGINKSYKQKELKLYLKNKKIKFAGLIKTRVKDHNISKVLNSIAPGWCCVHNYQYATNGRVWVIWDPTWNSINVIRMGAQFIHCNVKDRTGNIDCFVTIMYGYNTIEQRKDLWNTLVDISVNINKPWLTCGDFNVVLHPKDKLQGNPISYGEIQDFATCIQSLLLNELS